jgi:hypothetical protein
VRGSTRFFDEFRPFSPPHRTELALESGLHPQTELRAGGLDQYMVHLILAGSAVGDCEGTTYRAGPGDIRIRDLSRPFDSATTPGSTITVVVPRERIDRRLGGRLRHGYALADGDPRPACWPTS